jgi:hypothetical protein
MSLKNKKPQSPDPETGRRLRFIRFEFEYEGLFRVNGNLHFQLGNHLELYFSVNESKEGMIFTKSYVIARAELCSSLANENVSGENGFSAKTFYSESLGIRIPAVL